MTDHFCESLIIFKNYLSFAITKMTMNKFFDFRELAVKLWSSADLDFPTTLCSELLIDIEHPVECIQAAAAQALAALLENNPGEVKPILDKLLQLYNERLVVCMAVLSFIFCAKFTYFCKVKLLVKIRFSDSLLLVMYFEFSFNGIYFYFCVFYAYIITNIAFL